MAISADDRVAMQWSTSSHLARRLLRRELHPHCETLCTGGAPEPPEASNTRWLTHVNHVMVPMGRTRADVVDIVDLARQSVDSLNKRIARVASA